MSFLYDARRVCSWPVESRAERIGWRDPESGPEKSRDAIYGPIEPGKYVVGRIENTTWLHICIADFSMGKACFMASLNA
jgi:hypothetical protein